MHRTRQAIRAGLLFTALTVMPELAWAHKPGTSQTRSVSLEVNIDEDGKLDLVTANLRPPARMFWLNIKLSTGREFSPLSGYIDPARARMSLTFRDANQFQDIRCAEWRPSKTGVTCGVPLPSHSVDRAIAFDTGQQIYLIHYSEGPQWGGRVSNDHEHAYFKVMPAIEGGLTPVAAE
ncbi:hypothetical protein GGC65_004072 [Sphingopyxis sp. OAS728]|uniref:hypothetical protein n=1 Tax=Sphingopyxis sp. OAS728 TaxID=2663823 RepID=UPI00178A617E|nr:hypothetical protein [Sphingopyxis sp. OAS728]MBE1529616.1 hypothetical protein [Sphingopyxis sp. OAS728]